MVKKYHGRKTLMVVNTIGLEHVVTITWQVAGVRRSWSICFNPFSKFTNSIGQINSGRARQIQKGSTFGSTKN